MDGPHHRHADDEQDDLTGEDGEKERTERGRQEDLQHRGHRGRCDQRVHHRPQVGVDLAEPPARPRADEVGQRHPPELPGPRERAHEVPEEVAEHERGNQLGLPDHERLQDLCEPELHRPVRRRGEIDRQRRVGRGDHRDLRNPARGSPHGVPPGQRTLTTVCTPPRIR